MPRRATLQQQSSPNFYTAINVGFELDGTGANYDRPVLVIQDFNPHVFFGVALTKNKQKRYYAPIGKVEGREASVILSQTRLINTKRLIRKAGNSGAIIWAMKEHEVKIVTPFQMAATPISMAWYGPHRRSILGIHSRYVA